MRHKSERCGVSTAERSTEIGWFAVQQFWIGLTVERSNRRDADQDDLIRVSSQCWQTAVCDSYRPSDSRLSYNWSVTVTIRLLARYWVEARIKLIKSPPTSVFDSSSAPEVIVPMPWVPGVP